MDKTTKIPKSEDPMKLFLPTRTEIATLDEWTKPPVWWAGSCRKTDDSERPDYLPDNDIVPPMPV